MALASVVVVLALTVRVLPPRCLRTTGAEALALTSFMSLRLHRGGEGGEGEGVRPPSPSRLQTALFNRSASAAAQGPLPDPVHTPPHSPDRPSAATDRKRDGDAASSTGSDWGFSAMSMSDEAAFDTGEDDGSFSFADEAKRRERQKKRKASAAAPQSASKRERSSGGGGGVAAAAAAASAADADGSWGTGDEGSEFVRSAAAAVPHNEADSKEAFRRAAAAQINFQHHDLPPQEGPRPYADDSGAGSGGAASSAAADRKAFNDQRTNEVCRPLDSMEERLALYEARPESERWCPMCAIENLAQDRSLTNKVMRQTPTHRIFDQINALPERLMLGKNYASWVYQVQMMWDLHLRPHVKKNELYGILVDKPEWSFDAILYHFMRERITEKMMDLIQIRDLHNIITNVKKEMKVVNSAGVVKINPKMLPAFLQYGKELRSRLKEHRQAIA